MWTTEQIDLMREYLFTSINELWVAFWSLSDIIILGFAAVFIVSLILGLLSKVIFRLPFMSRRRIYTVG